MALLIRAEEVPPLMDHGQGHPSACHFAEVRQPLAIDEPASEPSAL
jgi:hypothetical protein